MEVCTGIYRGALPLLAFAVWPLAAVDSSLDSVRTDFQQRPITRRARPGRGVVHIPHARRLTKERASGSLAGNVSSSASSSRSSSSLTGSFRTDRPSSAEAATSGGGAGVGSSALMEQGHGRHRARNPRPQAGREAATAG